MPADNDKSHPQATNLPEQKSVTCPFCDESRARSAIAVHGSVFAVKDLYPVTDGHMLVIPKRHTTDLFSMSADEQTDALSLLNALGLKAQESDSSILGFNVGINCGAVAGQTVMHAHIHLIPRRAGDTPDPRGGVRGVIPNKMRYD
jgi:diadenosine tetraphosphate (Ap4A) HIT family hydrolase